MEHKVCPLICEEPPDHCENRRCVERLGELTRIIIEARPKPKPLLKLVKRVVGLETDQPYDPQ